MTPRKHGVYRRLASWLESAGPPADHTRARLGLEALADRIVPSGAGAPEAPYTIQAGATYTVEQPQHPGYSSPGDDGSADVPPSDPNSGGYSLEGATLTLQQGQSSSTGTTTVTSSTSNGSVRPPTNEAGLTTRPEADLRDAEALDDAADDWAESAASARTSQQAAGYTQAAKQTRAAAADKRDAARRGYEAEAKQLKTTLETGGKAVEGVQTVMGLGEDVGMVQAGLLWVQGKPPNTEANRKAFAKLRAQVDGLNFSSSTRRIVGQVQNDLKVVVAAAGTLTREATTAVNTGLSRVRLALAEVERAYDAFDARASDGVAAFLKNAAGTMQAVKTDLGRVLARADARLADEVRALTKDLDKGLSRIKGWARDTSFLKAGGDFLERALLFNEVALTTLALGDRNQKLDALSRATTRKEFVAAYQAFQDSQQAFGRRGLLLAEKAAGHILLGEMVLVPLVIDGVAEHRIVPNTFFHKPPAELARISGEYWDSGRAKELVRVASTGYDPGVQVTMSFTRSDD